MSLVRYYNNLSLSKKLYFATATGLLLGMFFGIKCSLLEPVNELFIRLFQVTIIPFMIFSILHSIGSLTKENAKLVGKKGITILILLWSLSIFYAFGLAYSFPDIERSNFFRPENDLGSTGISLLDLFIPSNPFKSIANGYIPAIVIFCILVGMALIRNKNKAKLVENSGMLALLMKEVNDYITVLLPFGVLIMSTYTFGTLSFIKFKVLLLYIIASLFYLFFISMLVYPGIVTSVSKLNYKKFLHYTMPAAIIAFTTGSVFLALPVIYNMMYEFDEIEEAYASDDSSAKDKGRNIISVIVPLAWVVPASYKFLVIFFIVFARWYYNNPFNMAEQILHYIAGIPCLFGNNAAIVPFLLEISGIPNKAYSTFMLVSNFMVYFNNANAAMFIIVCTILCYLAISNKIKVCWLKLISILCACTVLFIIVLISLSYLMAGLLQGDEQVNEELKHMNLQGHNLEYYGNIEAKYFELSQYHSIAYLNPNETLLGKIVRTKTLQVGYDPEAIPFSFFNARKELVGYDIDFVYDIAEDLGCTTIEFYPVYSVVNYNECLNRGIFLDICVGGLQYMSALTGDVICSDPYMKYTPALVIPIKYKKVYTDFNSVLKAKDLTFGAFEDFEYSNKHFVRAFRSEHKVKVMKKFSDYYNKHESDVLITSAEIASAIDILTQGYWVVYSKEQDIKLYYAYLLPYTQKAETFRNVVNTWIRIIDRDTLQEKRFKYWVMGQIEIKHYVPWSILSWLQKKNFFIRKDAPPLSKTINLN
ncbi:MAG TPA: hypothetical protein DD381_01050 [Lentisphaeria bacterium]|nr:MAG: hypothetical protein A2X47_05930 [Lentisphaerae bacterium GWF2_38_69]HBM14930.1 hypothetical protein [Lentisphaeria bacterium]